MSGANGAGAGAGAGAKHVAFDKVHIGLRRPMVLKELMHALEDLYKLIGRRNLKKSFMQSPTLKTDGAKLRAWADNFGSCMTLPGGAAEHRRRRPDRRELTLVRLHAAMAELYRHTMQRVCKPKRTRLIADEPAGAGNPKLQDHLEGRMNRLAHAVAGEDGEDDQGMSAVLPGMLDNLNMDMFGGSTNSGDDIDIGDHVVIGLDDV